MPNFPFYSGCMNFADFTPPRALRPAMMQTFLAGQKFRRKGPNAMVDAATEEIITTAEGVRLKGAWSPHPQSKGTIIFIHGWEGSQNSTYVLCCGRYMFDHGYSVYRLNLRDHGDTHALNEGVFYGALFDEVDDAVRQIACDKGGDVTALVGFSLGGNFALRIARQTKKVPCPDLSHIFAISPVIDPFEAAPIPDQKPLIKRYFMNKWRSSLAKKHEAFPDIYPDNLLAGDDSIMGLTAKFVPMFTPFDSVADFFNAYKIHPDDLTGLSIPTEIIMSVDDPVVPADPLYELNIAEPAKLTWTKFGGHNGFFNSLMGPTWYDSHIKKTLESSVSGRT